MRTEVEDIGKSRPAPRGFTLVELLIAVIIAAVLAAIAFPSYMNSIRKSRRADAVSYLTSIQQAQERWRANNAMYSSSLSALVPSYADVSPAGYYTISIDALPPADASNYVLRATAKANTSQGGDSNCLNLLLQSAGGNVFYWGCASCTATTPPAAITDPNRCWVR